MHICFPSYIVSISASHNTQTWEFEAKTGSRTMKDLFPLSLYTHKFIQVLPHNQMSSGKEKEEGGTLSFTQETHLNNLNEIISNSNR